MIALILKLSVLSRDKRGGVSRVKNSEALDKRTMRRQNVENTPCLHPTYIRHERYIIICRYVVTRGTFSLTS